MESKKAMVTACDARFLVGAKALIKSVNMFHPDVQCYCFVPSADKACITKELSGLADVLEVPRVLKGVPDNLQIAVAKLFTPTVDEEVAVWIDCDCVLCGRAQELWEVPKGMVNVVQDTAYSIKNMVEPAFMECYERQFPGLSVRRGFNGGLFALHTLEWKDLPERYEKAFVEGGYAFHPKIFDQPFLNGLFRDHVRWLPFKFNAHHGFDYPVPRDVRVMHFTNIPKPWMPEYPKHQPQYYYWLRYGEGETNRWRLFFVKMRIILRTPRRLIMRWIRKYTRFGLVSGVADKKEGR